MRIEDIGMNRSIAAGIVFGLAAGLLGPITNAIGEQSGSHPTRDRDAGAYAEMRRAVRAEWVTTDGDARYVIRVNAFRHDEIYAGAGPVSIPSEGIRAAKFMNGRVTLTRTVCDASGECDETVRLADIGPRTGNWFTMEPFGTTARVVATFPRPEGGTCTVKVDWLKYTMPIIQTAHENSVATGQGSCFGITGFVAETDRAMTWSTIDYAVDYLNAVPSPPVPIPQVPTPMPTLGSKR